MNKLIKEELLNTKYIKWYGRYYYDEATGINHIYNAVSGFMVKVCGSSLKVDLVATNTREATLIPFVKVVIDGDFSKPRTYIISNETQKIDILLDNKPHYIEFYKQSEAIRNHLGIVSIETDGELLENDYKFSHVVEVIGDSTIAGYGNLGNAGDTVNTANTNALEDYTFMALKKLNCEVHTVCASGWGMKASRWTNPKTINMPDFKDKCAVLTDKPWDQTKINPELIIIGLGTNDTSYIYESGEKDEARRQDFIKAYVDFVDYKLNVYPNAHIFMDYGTINDYNTFPSMIEIYDIVSKKHKNVHLVRLYGDAAATNGHPSLHAHYRMSEELYQIIKETFHW